MIKRRSLSVFIFLITITAGTPAADIFGFNAPPGGVYLNCSFEQNSEVKVDITVEHEGVGISSWFIAADEGASSSYEPRQLVSGGNTLNYQIYKSASPSTEIIKAPPEVLALSNVVTSADFSSAAATTETQTFSIYFYASSGQFIPAGTYTDTITLYLYEGDYSNAGTHVPVDSVSITVNGRMARLIDIYSIREPGIRFMDLTISQSNKLIATVNERSNSATGYTVSVTSYNLENDSGGATAPFFLHSSGTGSLGYSLTYDGTLVGGWSSGSAFITDSNATTLPEWLSKELRISYSGSPVLPAGDYEDILTLTISAK